jgi:hypothetical protein
MESLLLHKPSPTSNNRTGARTMVRTMTSTTQQGGKKRGKQTNRGQMVLFRHVRDQSHVNRVLRSSLTLSSTAGGVIALANVASTGVTSTPDWTNISQEFASYRVRRLKIYFRPATVNATSITGPYQGCLYVCRWWQFAPATISGIEQTPEVAIISTLEEFSYENNYLGFSKAQEFTSTGSSILADSVYGMSFITPAGTAGLALSSIIYSLVVEYDVEFMAVH